MQAPRTNHGLRFGPIGPHTIHLCVDMQRMFSEPTPWRLPWMTRVLPQIIELVRHAPKQAIFTRFVPAERPGDGCGTWERYWQKWACMTRSEIDPSLIDIVPELGEAAPAATVIDKSAYSPWIDAALEDLLRGRHTDTLIVTGGETDVCVLSTVLGAVDRGYRVILPTDALCSSSDEAHDASLTVYSQRYAQQVETVETALVMSAWKPAIG